jgi:predicted kinase
MSQTIKVEKKQVEYDIALFRAKAELQRRLLLAYSERSVAERRLVGEYLKASGMLSPLTPLMSVFNDWCGKHKAEADAQEDIYRVQLKEFESQVQIREAILADGNRLVIDPTTKM